MGRQPDFGSCLPRTEIRVIAGITELVLALHGLRSSERDTLSPGRVYWKSQEEKRPSLKNAAPPVESDEAACWKLLPLVE